MEIFNFATDLKIGFNLPKTTDINIGDIVVVPGLNHLTEVEIIGMISETQWWGISRCEFI